MRSKRLLVLAAVLVVVGFVLTQVFEPPDGDYFFSSYEPLTNTEDLPGSYFLFLSTGDFFGIAALWAASILVAGVVGFRLARRP